MIGRRHRVTVGLVALALAAVAAQPAVARPAAAACSAGQLSGHLRDSSPDLGSIVLSIAVRNISPQACTLRGFPGLRLHSAAGPLPTHVVLLHLLAILDRPVTTVYLVPGARASLLVAYPRRSDGSKANVPIEPGSCKNVKRLSIILGHSHGSFSLPLEAHMCSSGLSESPFVAGLVNA